MSDGHDTALRINFSALSSFFDHIDFFWLVFMYVFIFHVFEESSNSIAIKSLDLTPPLSFSIRAQGIAGKPPELGFFFFANLFSHIFVSPFSSRPSGAERTCAIMARKGFEVPLFTGCVSGAVLRPELVSLQCAYFLLPTSYFLLPTLR